MIYISPLFAGTYLIKPRSGNRNMVCRRKQNEFRLSGADFFFSYGRSEKKAVAANRPVLAAASASIPPIDIFSLFECHVFRNPVSIWLGPKKNPFLGQELLIRSLHLAPVDSMLFLFFDNNLPEMPLLSASSLLSHWEAFVLMKKAVVLCYGTSFLMLN